VPLTSAHPWEILPTAPPLAERLTAIRGARILLVEDDSMLRELGEELLVHAGFVVDLAEDGRMAVAMVRSAEYDLVLMDMHMPLLDGAAATRELRADGRFDDLPVIGLTASAAAEGRERCLAAGMNDYLAKPVEPEELWSALSKWVRPRDSGAPPERGDTRPARDFVFPNDIAGLDVSDGLQRMLGKMPLYVSMLQRFVGGQKNVATSIRSALAADDSDTAERLAHTLKGVSGSIGAKGLQQEAGELEAAISEHQPRDAVEARLSELSAQLQRLIEQLEESLPEESHETPATVDLRRLDGVRRRLEALLAADDAEAAEVISADADLLRAGFPNHFRALDAAIHAFDFDAAAAVLRAARGPANR
jgi:two-component system sensor histidine kinase/response regulator